MEPKNESLTNKKLTEVETNEAKKPTKKDPKEMVSGQPQQFLIQLMSGDIDPNMMMDEDDYTAEQIEDLKLSIKEWLGRVPFTEFRNAIHKDVIGQDNLDLILANVYNYLTNVALGNPVNNNMLMAAPSGCGKTETYRSLRNYFKTEIPELTISQVVVCVITEEGIVGAGSSILVDELMENGTNGYGIVFMDEFDKKLIPSFAEGANTSAAVQNQL